MKIDIAALVVDAQRIQAGGKKVKYPAEFQRRAVAALRQFNEKELTLTLGLGKGTLYKWQQQLGATRTKGSARQTKSPVPIEFSELRLPADAPTDAKTIINHTEPACTGQARIEFSDEQGRRLSVSIPWSRDVAGSLFQFIAQTMSGGVACCK